MTDRAQFDPLRRRGLMRDPKTIAVERETAAGVARATSDWIKIKTPAGKAIDEERAKWNDVFAALPSQAFADFAGRDC